jgi:hypothetical protein
MDINGKKILITGASGLWGAAYARGSILGTMRNPRPWYGIWGGRVGSAE